MNGSFRVEEEDVPSSEFKAYSMQAITQQVTTAFCDTRFNLFSRR